MQWPWICVEDKGTAWEQKNAPHYLMGVGYALASFPALQKMVAGSLSVTQTWAQAHPTPSHFGW